MIPRSNTLDMQHALVSAYAIRQAARSFAHFSLAMKQILFDMHVHRAWFSSPRLVIAWSAAPDTQSQVKAGSSESNSSVENELDAPEKIRRYHDVSKPFWSDTASPRFAAQLGIFSAVLHSVAASPYRNPHAHHGKSRHPDKREPDPLAALKQNANRLARESVAPFAPFLNRVLVDATKAINEVRTFLGKTSIISQITKWIVLGIVGKAATYVTDKLIAPLRKGFRIVLSPVSAFRWLLSTGAPLIVSWFMESLAAIGRSVAIFIELSLGWYVVIAVALAVAGYELYRHCDAAKRLLSRSVDSAHKAVARLLKWLGESVVSAIPFASGALVAVKPANLNVPRFSAARPATARGIYRARAVEHTSAAVVRPAPMLRAVRRAAAAAAFATPLMLTAGPARAFATPLISTNDTARIAAPLLARGMTQGPIVINYAPSVVIHSEDAAESAALKRRVMEVLERHGRELHQVLAREIVRQQRREFNPLLSNQ
jgi:hypothetical protein